MDNNAFYIVRFVRNDSKPDEEYFYNRLEDAKYHFSLFEQDDSKIYTRIELLCSSSVDPIKAILFD